MFWQTWRVGDRTYRKRCRRGEHVETALVARRDGWQDDTSLSFETYEAEGSRIRHTTGDRWNHLVHAGPTFSAAIDQRLETFWDLWVDEVDESGAHPPASVDRVQSADDEIELHVVVVIFILNLAMVAESPR